MTGLIWTSIVSIGLGALAILIGIIAVFTQVDLTELVLGLGASSVALAILAIRDE